MGGRPTRADVGASRGPAPLISRDSAVPLHAQFRLYLIDLIERGELAPGAQVPRERELAERFDVSLAPVRQAILDLAKEGYVYRVRGKGTFVRAAKVEEKIAILGSFTEAMRAKGLAARLQVLRPGPRLRPRAIARQLRTRGRVVRIRAPGGRRRPADGSAGRLPARAAVPRARVRGARGPLALCPPRRSVRHRPRPCRERDRGWALRSGDGLAPRAARGIARPAR